MATLPDEAWLAKVHVHLAQDAAWSQAMERIGQPVYLEILDGEASARIIIDPKQLGTPPLLLGADDAAPTEDVLPVRMDVDTWDGLLRGVKDVMGAYMTGDMKVKAGMMRIMKIATPAETLFQRLSWAMKEPSQ